MNTSRISTLLTIAVTALLSACTVSKTSAPPLQGPSVLGTGLIITASPDVLSMDGASQSLITIEARDANGQPLANLQLRVEIIANGQYVDFGSLSARTVVTNSNGRATVVYTAPTAVQGAIPTLEILVTPAGTDSHEGFPTGRFITIRLVPPGVITGGGPTPSFTFFPANPAAFTDVQFDGSASKSSLGSSIVSYSWNFGDGSTATGQTATYRFRASGTYHVTLTVVDSNGLSSSTSKDVPVGAGSAPTANFIFSPTSPAINQDINFNAGSSTAGAGHTIVRYDWDFGSGAPQSGVTVTKAYDAAGTYNVQLTVTDEAGQRGLISKGVSVAGGLTAAFTTSPTDPHSGELVNFNGRDSTAAPGGSITNYAWDFGDGATSLINAGTTASHAYVVTSSRTFTVRLTVTDNQNRTATVTKSLTINP